MYNDDTLRNLRTGFFGNNIIDSYDEQPLPMDTIEMLSELGYGRYQILNIISEELEDND